jgi:NTP pyrophosphatase (non-canonical NTP hydrolase)
LNSGLTTKESQEIADAIKNNDRDEIIDGIGDTLVTLIIQAKMQGLNLLDCLESAYNVIANRTGKIENGQFVKDE